jgi:hypothetical protein
MAWWLWALVGLVLVGVEVVTPGGFFVIFFGVAALVVAAEGKRDRRTGGLTLDPKKTERLLGATATPTPCPAGGVQTYPDPDLDPALYTARCTGTTSHNSFYGDGVVNALQAAQLGRR